jgi:hypothetical protein
VPPQEPSPAPKPPPSLGRLFPHVSLDEADAAAPSGYARLLEDGAGEDLRWLFRLAGEPAIAAWFARLGGRALSRRSRAHWQIVLGVSAPAPSPTACELWPLA